jgi:hypothetical protein
MTAEDRERLGLNPTIKQLLSGLALVGAILAAVFLFIVE